MQKQGAFAMQLLTFFGQNDIVFVSNTFENLMSL